MIEPGPILTCAGAAVVVGEVEQPLTGAWHATLRIDADTAPRGAVVLRWHDGATWRGTVATGGDLAPGGPVECMVVGGAGGLSRRVPGGSYRRATVKQILAQVLGPVGEEAAGGIAPDLLARTLPRWSRAEGPAAAQLDALALELGAIWRVLPDGGVWLGVAPTGAYSLPQGAEVVRRSPAEGRIELSLAAPWRLAPGGLWDGRVVASVAVELGPDRLRGALCLS